MKEIIRAKLPERDISTINSFNTTTPNNMPPTTHIILMLRRVAKIIIDKANTVQAMDSDACTCMELASAQKRQGKSKLWCSVRKIIALNHTNKTVPDTAIK